MKVKMFDKEWNINDITYKEKRELWKLSVKSFPEGEINQDNYFVLMDKVEELSGLVEKDIAMLTMGEVDQLLQEVFQQYVGIEKKG
jgi:hypothetical protein